MRPAPPCRHVGSDHESGQASVPHGPLCVMSPAHETSLAHRRNESAALSETEAYSVLLTRSRDTVRQWRC